LSGQGRSLWGGRARVEEGHRGGGTTYQGRGGLARRRHSLVGWRRSRIEEALVRRRTGLEKARNHRGGGYQLTSRRDSLHREKK